MATVIRISYCPKDDWDLQDMKDCRLSYTPTWEIAYSFNPPDDASSAPLVHTVKTHVLPDGLKEGCLIPILYRIMDEEGKHVRSMPFPVPVCDYADIDVK